MSILPDKNIRPWTKQAILNLSENLVGVYGIFKKDAWIYIGQGNLQERLLKHFNGDNPCITQAQPTNFTFEINTNAETREKQILRTTTTLCNKKVG